MFNIKGNPDEIIEIAEKKHSLGLVKQDFEDKDTESYLNEIPVLVESDIQEPKKSWKTLGIVSALLLMFGGAATALLFFNNQQTKEEVTSKNIVAASQSIASHTSASDPIEASSPNIANGSPFSEWCTMPIENLGNCEIPSRERLQDPAFKNMFFNSFAKNGIIQNHEKIKKSIEQMIFIRDQSEVKPDNEFVNNVYQIIRSGKPITLDEALALVEQSNKVLVAGLQNESTKMIAQNTENNQPKTTGKIKLGANSPPLPNPRPTVRKPVQKQQYENWGQPETPPQFYANPEPVYPQSNYTPSSQNDYPPPAAQSPIRLTNKALVVGDMKKEVAKQNREDKSVDEAVNKILSQEVEKTKNKPAKSVGENDDLTEEYQDTNKSSVFKRKTPIKKQRKQQGKEYDSGELSDQDIMDIEAVEKALILDDN